MKPRIVWSDDVLYFIIKYVQATPYVWNNFHPQFNNKRKKCKFWDNLTIKINSYGEFRSQNPRLTRDVLSRKWNNMKSYYVSERNRLDTTNRSQKLNEDGSNDTAVWKFMPAMSFLDGKEQNECFLKTETKTEISLSIDESPSGDNYDQLEEGYESSPDPLVAANIMGDTTIEANTTDCPLQQSTSDNNNGNSYLEVDIDDNVGENYHGSIMGQMIKFKKPLVKPTMRKIKNSYIHFAMVIAQDLDQLDEDLKIDAKLEIMQALAKYKKKHLLVERNRVIVRGEPM